MWCATDFPPISARFPSDVHFCCERSAAQLQFLVTAHSVQDLHLLPPNRSDSEARDGSKKRDFHLYWEFGGFLVRIRKRFQS